MASFVNLQSSCLIVTGKFDYKAAYSATKITGPLLFGFFSICFSFIPIKFFLTILTEAFEAVRRDPKNQSNDHEVIEYTMKRMKMMVGSGLHPRGRWPRTRVYSRMSTLKV